MLDLSKKTAHAHWKLLWNIKENWKDSNTKQVGWSAGTYCAIGKITNLGDGFKYFSCSNPNIGEDCSTHFDKLAYFFNWVGGKPPTNVVFLLDRKCYLDISILSPRFLEEPRHLGFPQDFCHVYRFLLGQLGKSHQPKPTQMCDWKVFWVELGSGRSPQNRSDAKRPAGTILKTNLVNPGL